MGGIRLHEVRIEEAYTKDYDDYEEGGPEHWPEIFDVSNWGFFIAFDGVRPVGGAVVVTRTPGVRILRGRTDLAVLWDIRVHRDLRRKGIGTDIFNHAAGWARAQGCRQLKIETQNVNVPACRFYKKQGCLLGEIDRYAYVGHAQVAHEVMLIWYLDLSDPA
jgi:streptothricin acetyltransferase